MTDIDEVVQAWQPFVNSIDNWQSLIEGIEPKQTNCGPVYELPSPHKDRTETFAIGDMRAVKLTQPHYHKNGETEIYFVIQGSGLSVVGGKEIKISKGTVVVIPPTTAHFTIPEKDLVLAIINSPSFNPANSVDIKETNTSVKFDKDQLTRLSHD